MSSIRAGVPGAAAKPARRAAPVSTPDTCDSFRDEVEDVVCAIRPEPFVAIGLWYRDFFQATDQEVQELLERASRAESAISAG